MNGPRERDKDTRTMLRSVILEGYSPFHCKVCNKPCLMMHVLDFAVMKNTVGVEGASPIEPHLCCKIIGHDTKSHVYTVDSLQVGLEILETVGMDYLKVTVC